MRVGTGLWRPTGGKGILMAKTGPKISLALREGEVDSPLDGKSCKVTLHRDVDTEKEIIVASFCKESIMAKNVKLNFQYSCSYTILGPPHLM